LCVKNDERGAKEGAHAGWFGGAQVGQVAQHGRDLRLLPCHAPYMACCSIECRQNTRPIACTLCARRVEFAPELKTWPRGSWLLFVRVFSLPRLSTGSPPLPRPSPLPSPRTRPSRLVPMPRTMDKKPCLLLAPATGSPQHPPLATSNISRTRGLGTGRTTTVLEHGKRALGFVAGMSLRCVVVATVATRVGA
jgi:hypothetical protein